MSEIYVKTKTSGKCRLYPDNPICPSFAMIGGDNDEHISPSVTSICHALAKFGLIDWAANCAVDYIMENGKSSLSPEEWHQLFDEARHAHEQVRDNAADFGTQAHLICQMWLENRKDEIEQANEEFYKTLILGGMTPDDAVQQVEKVIALFDSFATWAIENKIEPVHTEIKLHGDGYSGRCDLIAYRTDPKTGRRVLGLYDIKTGKGAYYPEWGLQLAGYSNSEHCDIDGHKGLVFDYDFQEIGIIKLNKDTLKCNFSEQRGPKFTADCDRLTEAWTHLVRFFWLYNDLEAQIKELEVLNESA